MSDAVTTTLFNNRESTPYAAGDTIFSAGDDSNCCYVVKQGRVGITADDDGMVAELGPGEIFGEMALIDNTPRSASAVALDECEIVEVPEARFDFMVQQTPGFAQMVMRTMAARLRAQTSAST